MGASTLLVGSLAVLDDTLVRDWLDLGEGRDVVVLRAAAAFNGPSEAARRRRRPRRQFRGARSPSFVVAHALDPGEL